MFSMLIGTAIDADMGVNAADGWAYCFMWVCTGDSGDSGNSGDRRLYCFMWASICFRWSMMAVLS